MQEREELKGEVRRKEEALADLIEADGEVIQDLLVRKIDTDEYEIIAGHHRRNACKILVEDGIRKVMPCFPVSFGTFQMYGLNLPAIPLMDMQQKRIMKLCVNWKE